MEVTISKEMCARSIDSIPNVSQETRDYFEKKKIKTVGEAFFGNKKVAKKHYNHLKVKVLWIVLDIQTVKG